MRATVFRDRLISAMKKSGEKDSDALFSRYQTYFADFFSKEEVQHKEENLVEIEDRISKSETDRIFNALVSSIDDPSRLKSYDRHSKRCAAKREKAAERRETAGETAVETRETAGKTG